MTVFLCHPVQIEIFVKAHSEKKLGKT